MQKAIFYVGLSVDIKSTLIRYFPGTPTDQQINVFSLLADFLSRPQTNTCFILKGYAGTGKTTIISTLVKVLPMLNMRSVLLAPTGRAAKVISSYSRRNAVTIHKKI